jgi:hypothetical protein
LDIEEINDKYKSLGETLLDIGRTNLGTFFEGVIGRTKTLSQAFSEMANSVLSTVSSMAAQLATVELFKLLGFSPKGLAGSQMPGIGSLFGFADGGFTGHGGKYEPKGIVHGSEFVLNSFATRNLGVDLLEKINQTGRVPTLALPVEVNRSQQGNQTIVNKTLNYNVQPAEHRFYQQERTVARKYWEELSKA